MRSHLEGTVSVQSPSEACFWTGSTDSYPSASIGSDPWFIMESKFATGLETAVTKEMLMDIHWMRINNYLGSSKVGRTLPRRA